MEFKECKDIDKLKDDEMRILYKFDFVKFQDLEKFKYPDGCITYCIIDDMIGTNIFKMGDHFLLIYVYVIDILHHQILLFLLSP